MKTITAIAAVLLLAGAATAAETMKTPNLRDRLPRTAGGDGSYECPATLTGIKLDIESTFTAPSGWTPKSHPTEYSNTTLTRAHHAVVGNMLWCTYAYGGATPYALRTTAISRAAPSGKTCTAVDGFRFTCQ